MQKKECVTYREPVLTHSVTYTNTIAVGSRGNRAKRELWIASYKTTWFNFSFISSPEAASCSIVPVVWMLINFVHNSNQVREIHFLCNLHEVNVLPEEWRKTTWSECASRGVKENHMKWMCFQRSEGKPHTWSECASRGVNENHKPESLGMPCFLFFYLSLQREEMELQRRQQEFEEERRKREEAKQHQEEQRRRASDQRQAEKVCADQLT